MARRPLLKPLLPKPLLPPKPLLLPKKPLLLPKKPLLLRKKPLLLPKKPLLLPKKPLLLPKKLPLRNNQAIAQKNSEGKAVRLSLLNYVRNGSAREAALWVERGFCVCGNALHGSSPHPEMESQRGTSLRER